jgi:hypothetical protein
MGPSDAAQICCMARPATAALDTWAQRLPCNTRSGKPAPQHALTLRSPCLHPPSSMIAVITPKASWATRWERLGRLGVQGIQAHKRLTIFRNSP